VKNECVRENVERSEQSHVDESPLKNDVTVCAPPVDGTVASGTS
jgi:hypothetical protein